MDEVKNIFLHPRIVYSLKILTSGDNMIIVPTSHPLFAKTLVKRIFSIIRQDPGFIWVTSPLPDGKWTFTLKLLIKKHSKLPRIEPSLQALRNCIKSCLYLISEGAICGRFRSLFYLLKFVFSVHSNTLEREVYNWFLYLISNFFCIVYTNPLFVLSA